jgi:hypothetical protein
MNLSETLREIGDRAGARSLIEHELANARVWADSSSLAVTLSNLGTLDLQDGALRDSAVRLAECYRIVAEHGLRRHGMVTIEAPAGLAAALGDDARAARWYGAVAALRAEGGFGRENVEAMTHDPIIAALRGRMGDAAFTAAAPRPPVRYEAIRDEIIAWLEERAQS